MCGIAGVLRLSDESPPVDPGSISRMTEQLRHRGPDDGGQFVAPEVGLGFTRLSIIDLEGGNQPHFNEDKSVVSVCNGEIYNYVELRDELKRAGHGFRSQCGVEVLTHLYEQAGTDFISRLNGQFAFAIYDQRRRELLLGRDQTGIAPLFYAIVNGQLIFASEIKALLEYPGVSREVNPAGLDQFFTFPGIVSPVTMFQGIHALPPGHYLRASRGNIETVEYWDLTYPRRDELGPVGDEQVSADEIEAAIEQAVRYRLQADVPVGFYLSGGLDSSLIAALIRQLRPQEQFDSFSIAFSDSGIDERSFQQIMATQVESRHHETEFDPGEVLSRLRTAVLHAETPLKESYNTCSLALSELVRRSGLKVVLSGEGADELFGGYVGYRFDQQRAAGGNGGRFDPETLLENEIRERLWGDPDFFYERDYLGLREMKSALYSPAMLDELDSFDATRVSPVDVSKIQGRHPIHKRSYLDFKLRLSDHLVADHGDRVAYANSIEARYPFLDARLIDSLTGVHPDLLVRNSTEKYLLRQVARRHVPEAVRSREKFAFVAGGSPWILQQNAEWVNDLLAPDTIKRQGYFNPQTIERLRTMYSQDGFTVNTTFESDLLMIVLTFGIFLETFKMPSR